MISTELSNFFKEQINQNNNLFGTTLPDKMVSFLGTSPEPGMLTKMFPRKIDAISKSDNNLHINLEFKSKLPHSQTKDETISVGIPDLKTFTGYQIKEGTILKDKSDNSKDVIEVKYAYTIHHTPNTGLKFDRLPYEDIISFGKSARFCIVAVGSSPNISPRFICHVQEADGKLKMFFGSGFMNKTYANYIKNKKLSLFIPNLETLNGYTFFGEGKNIEHKDNPEAYDKVKDLFNKGGWGLPRQVTEFTVDKYEKVSL